MFSKSQMPWVEYLEIDEVTGKRKLKEDTPEDIRKKYEEYLEQEEKEKRSGGMLAK